MKKLTFSMLAMAGLLFAACADKDVIGESGQQGEGRSEGYMALAINLPTTPSTRAANDVFDDGTENEYAVDNCALLIFQGTSEENATFLSVTEFKKDDMGEKDDADDDNITTSYLLATTVSGVDPSQKLYALALLNYTGILTVTDGVATLGGTLLSTLSDLRDLKIQDNDLTGSKKSFFMANAILSTTPGGATMPSAGLGHEVFQYARLDPNKIYDTADKAKADPAGEILVERAVAKATLRIKLADQNGIVTSDNATFLWMIDNTEPKTFIIRNPGDNKYINYVSGYYAAKGITPNYRFVGAASTKNSTLYGTGKDYYRSYWCIDPQYSVDNPTMIKGNKWGNVQTDDDDNPQYCYENTFDVPRQNYKNTTRAIIQVTLKPEGDTGEYPTFYTINGGVVKYANVDDAVSYVLESIMNMTNVVTAFKSSMTNPDETLTITDDYFIVETDDATAPAGQVKVESVTLNKENIDGTKFDVDKLETAFNAAMAGSEGVDGGIAIVNKNLVILKYIGGVMYYEARFKHFAGSGVDDYADLAPWNTWETGTNKPVSGPTTQNAYPGCEGGTAEEIAENYLGRYGMVRNNWYHVEVTAFNGYGYPVVPSVTVGDENPGYDDPDTPDDNLKENIAVKIHVLSWAKRKQSWSF